MCWHSLRAFSERATDQSQLFTALYIHQMILLFVTSPVVLLLLTHGNTCLYLLEQAIDIAEWLHSAVVSTSHRGPHKRGLTIHASYQLTTPKHLILFDSSGLSRRGSLRRPRSESGCHHSTFCIGMRARLSSFKFMMQSNFMSTGWKLFS